MVCEGEKGLRLCQLAFGASRYWAQGITLSMASTIRPVIAVPRKKRRKRSDCSFLGRRAQTKKVKKWFPKVDVLKGHLGTLQSRSIWHFCALWKYQLWSEKKVNSDVMNPISKQGISLRLAKLTITYYYSNETLVAHGLGIHCQHQNFWFREKLEAEIAGLHAHDFRCFVLAVLFTARRYPNF